MFSEEAFMNECIAFLNVNTYEDYEDVKVAISDYIDANLDIDIIGLEKIQELANNIIAEYFQSKYDDADSEAGTLNEDDEVVAAIHIVNNDDVVMMQAIWDWINDVA